MSCIRTAPSLILARSLSRRVVGISYHFNFQKYPGPFIRPHIRTMASIPSTMKAVIINKTGGTEVLEHKTDMPVPALVDGQLLVKNDYLGVNFIDT